MTSGTVTGFEETFTAFDRLGLIGRKEASIAVAETVTKVHGDVLRLIQRGEKSGHIYKRSTGQNLSGEHQASAPGEAPATDTGSYIKSIHPATRGLNGEVYSRSPLAFWLEYGTKRMKPRPHFAPAAAMNRDYFTRRIQRAMERAERAFNK